MGIEVLLWVILFGLLFLGVPIFVSIGMTVFIVIIMADTIVLPLTMIPLDLYRVSELFPLLAVPAFILAGAIMERGGMAQQIINIALVIVGRVTGGLGLATIAGCVFFSAMIGSAPATAAAMGALMIPAMVRHGYAKDYAASVTATGGTLGILLPPSNPMIIYAVVANVSITGMFMAGVIPGLMVATALALTAYLAARRRGYKGIDKKYTRQEVVTIFRTGIWSLFCPIFVLGGIYGGFFTPIEASVMAVVYALFVGIVINRELTMPRLWDCFRLTNAAAGIILVIVGISLLFGRIITILQIPQTVAAAVTQISTEPFTVLVLLGIFLFFIGLFMETLATIVIITPIVLPLLAEVGINPIHFGIVLIMVNEIALTTPPVGINLFVVMGLTGLTLERIAIAVIPYVISIAICAVLVMRFEEIALFLPRMLLWN